MKVLGAKILEFIREYILLRNQRLMTKLFAFASVLVILPICTVAAISYYQSSVELEEEARQFSYQVIEQLETHIEYYLRDFEIITLKVLNDPELIRLVRMNSIEEIEESRIRSSIQNLLKESAFSRADISNITVFIDNLQVIDSLGERNRNPAVSFKDEYWYSMLPANGSPILITRNIKLADKEEPVISVVRRIYSPETLQPIGVLVLDINFRRIVELSNKVSISPNGYFFIMDSEGHYVYHPDSQKLGQKVEFDQISSLSSHENGSILLRDKQKQFVTYTYSSNLGWWFLTSIPYDDLTKGVIKIGRYITWTAVISLLVAYLLGYGFSINIIRPIRRLQQFMKEAEVGNLSGRVEVESKDEIGQLSVGFNKMADHLSSLLQEVYFAKLRETEMSLRQKEMELKVLQSQINPHFLFNSLETIRGMAIEKNADSVAEMSSALGQLLRYNLRNYGPTVTLREELKFCELYLQIQKFRFEDRFSYKFDIPAWAMNLQVVKFSLQPLVENCFVHGVAASSFQVEIVISAIRESDNSFVIRVADTGTGMSEKTVAFVIESLRERNVINGGSNLGIVNVHRRIVSLFGPDYGLDIQSEIGKGTLVSIRLPFNQTMEGEFR